MFLDGGVPLLAVRDLVKTFGGFRALDRLSFDLAPGQVLGLVGPNGSGKTTCINVISGLYPPDSGTVQLGGAGIGGLPAHRIARRGINRTFQAPKPFVSLTVRENLRVAADFGRALHAGPYDEAALLDRLALASVADRPAADLNSAQQKLLDLGRALATAPSILLVDEIAAGLNPVELDRMAYYLRALAEDGMAVLIVEHLMRFIDSVADRVLVLNAGREIFAGTLAAATRDPTVITVFLGGGHG